MPPKIHIHPLETSPMNISPRTNSKILTTNPSMSWPNPDHSPNILNPKESEAEFRAQSRKNQSFKNQCQNQVHSKKKISLPLSSEDITIAETYQSELITKTLSLNSYGKSQSNPSITITTSLSSLTEPAKNSIPIALLQSLELTIYLIKEATRFYQLYPN